MLTRGLNERENGLRLISESTPFYRVFTMEKTKTKLYIMINITILLVQINLPYKIN